MILSTMANAPPTQVLRESNKLRLPEDAPDSPSFIRDRTPLRKGQISTFDLRGEFRKDPALPILITDMPFTRGIQNGVERGEYVYRFREPLFGPGDPFTHINISDDAFVFTMTYARKHGIWPRPKPSTGEPAPQPLGQDGFSPVPPSATPTPMPPAQPGLPGIPARPGAPSGSSGPFIHEGVLREALKIVFEKARAAGASRIDLLSIRLFEQVDAFRMLSLVSGIPGAKVNVEFEGHYGTEAGAEFEYSFRGPVDDVLPVKDFLAPKYRAATDRMFNATFTLTFASGLPLQGDAADKITQKLTQQSMGAAYVTASLET